LNYWLLKSEPDEYGWNDLLKDGKFYWYGVRNFRARNNLKLMKKGDLGFFYHSNVGKEIVGVMEIVKEHYQDPTTEDERWVVVDVVPKFTLPKSVTLAEIKANPKLANMQLIKISRLSVAEVTKEEWDEVIKMSKTK
jgi:predicted RNA-binding protein with PUA-like domain